MLYEIPGSPEKDWHKDWLSRIVPHKLFSKGELKVHAAKNFVALDSYIDGKKFKFGYNYVLFSGDPSQTLVFEHPPTVAHARPLSPEVWSDDELSGEVFERTIVTTQPKGVKRFLRLPKQIQPHSPPLRGKLSESEVRSWRNDFFQLLLVQGLGRC